MLSYTRCFVLRIIPQFIIYIRCFLLLSNCDLLRKTPIRRAGGVQMFVIKNPEVLLLLFKKQYMREKTNKMILFMVK